VLLVGVNSDESAARLKGPGRPIMPACDRIACLKAVRWVNWVFTFEEDTPEPMIRRLRPDVLVKGPEAAGTEIPGAEFVKSYGGSVVVPDWKVEHSTTAIIEKIRQGAKA
jgi:D-beta-D-heptose 7-phosphate kinase/D-beta-D-heptose 1-phosphate adenosyltransferase